MGILRRRMVAGAVVGAAVGRNRANKQNAAGKTAQADQAAPQSAVDPAEELKKLAELKDQGIITQEEFDQKKKELLGL